MTAIPPELVAQLRQQIEGLEAQKLAKREQSTSIGPELKGELFDPLSTILDECLAHLTAAIPVTATCGFAKLRK